MYETARHETLIEAQWDEERVVAAIDEIVRNSYSRFDPQTLWPIHPLDLFRNDLTEPLKMLYFGAAGVIWALDYLNKIGATSVKEDFSMALSELASKNRNEMALSERETASYWMGDVGILLVHWRLFPTHALADAIYRAVEANIDNPTREFMWGAPGTMLAALFMYEFTQDERWKEVYLQSVRQLMGDLGKNNEYDCYVWAPKDVIFLTSKSFLLSRPARRKLSCGPRRSTKPTAIGPPVWAAQNTWSNIVMGRRA